MKLHKEEKQPSWYYRSDDKPIEKLEGEKKWTLYKESDQIEECFQEYLLSMNEMDMNENKFAIYKSKLTTYYIDFKENIQKDLIDISNIRIIGRFEGDNMTKNTLNYFNSIVLQNLESKKLLNNSEPKSIMNSLQFDSDEAFINHNYLQFIFKIIEKLSNDKQAIEDLNDYSIKYINYYELNKEKQISVLKEFIIDHENGKIRENSVRWYTKESFINRMINTCLRKMNYTEVFLIRNYLYHLRNNLKEISKKNKAKKLFIGTKLSNEEITRIKNFQGQPFHLNGFISKSGNISVAFKIMTLQQLDENQYSRILFQIDAEAEEMTNYSCIKDFSLSADEDEHLINLNVFLKIKKVEEKIFENTKYYHFYLKLSNESELIVQKETQFYKKSMLEIYKKDYNLDSFYIAEIFKLLKKQEEIINLIGNLRLTNEIDISISYSLIGEFYYEKKQFDKAISFYQKSLEIYLKTVGSNHHETANCYNNIGLAYDNKGEYDRTIDYYRKSLEIYLKTVGSIHHDTANCYNNIGSAYDNKRDHDNAIDYYNKSLEIYLKTVGSNHPETAYCYNNIGLALNNKRDFDSAIENYNKSLEIRLKTLGSDHPDTASSFNSIGLSYYNKEDYDRAIEFYNKSLEIRLKTIGSNHPDTASSFNNIGLAYESLGKYDRAIEYYDKSSHIRKESVEY